MNEEIKNPERYEVLVKSARQAFRADVDYSIKMLYTHHKMEARAARWNQLPHQKYKDLIVERQKAGESVHDLAAEYGVKAVTIQKLFRDSEGMSLTAWQKKNRETP